MSRAAVRLFLEFAHKGVLLLCQGQRHVLVCKDRAAQDYVRATSGFDQALLQQILAPNYQEISPVGEVDARDKVISFYPAAAKAKAPPVTPVLSELTSRVYGEALVISTGKLTYSFAGTPHSRSMRVQFVSALQQNRWQLVSAQFTGIPAAKK